ncbi:predicted protein, partial [Nematostella vectensis]
RFLSSLTQYDDFLENVLKPLMRVRTPGSEGHRIVKTFIKDFLKKLGWNVSTDEFEADTPFGVKHFENIIATVNPEAERRLVIAAHYDSKYYPKTKEPEFIGAIDSAVPCAMMLELAVSMRHFFNHLKKVCNSYVTLQMVFFDGEEAFKEWSASDSIYGARHLAERWQNESQLDNVESLILLDLIGSPRPAFYDMSSKTSPYFHRLHKIEVAMANRGDLIGPYENYFRTNIGLQEGIYIEDDHIPFLRKGVPILHIIPIPFPEVWHKSTDDAQHLDHVVIENLIKIFREFIAEEYGL